MESQVLRKLRGRSNFLGVQNNERKVDAKGKLRVNNRRYALPPEVAECNVQICIIGETVEVFAKNQRIRTFNMSEFSHSLLR